MDVTRDNFEASLDALSAAIADPHFAFWSFDLEFTGLNASSATTFDLLDTPSDRFSKVHESCRRMTVLQYGVCCFAFHPSTRRWTARPFNFWLFPDSGRGSDAVFSCQASSMAFLADCGFDFNKAIRRGVPFVPAAERERNAQRRARAANRPPIVPTNERDKEMVRRLREDVAAWLERGEPPGDADENEDPSDGNETPSDPVRPISPDDLVLEPTNSFLRALTYQTLERETFGATNPPGYLATTRRDFPDGAARVVLRRASEAEIRADAEARAAKAASEERTRDGFASALRLLCASGKPAVAHNALYDATFTLEKFLSDLDGSYEGFKSAFDDAIRGAFYDTKHLARTFADRWFADESRPAAPGDTAAVAAPPLDTALGPLYENLSSRPVPESSDGTTAPGRARGTPRGRARRAVEADANDAATILDAIDFPVGFDRYAAALRRPGPDDADDADAVAALAKECASFAHEAGYDAYMTGVCFLTMALYGRGAVDADGVGSPRVFPADSRDGDGDGIVPPPGRRAIGLLGNAPFADEDGIIPLQHSDMSHVHLRGDDPIPDRSRVVYLVGLAPGTNGGELARRFRDAGLGNPSHVSWTRRDVARVIGAPIDERAMKDAANGDRLASGSGSVAVTFDARSVERALRAGGLRAEVMSHDAWMTRRDVAPSETSLGTFLARVGLGAKRAREASGAHDDGANGRKRARGDAEVAGSNSCAVM